MSQLFVSDATGLIQSQVSTIEAGTNGGLDIVIVLLNYYGKHFDLSQVFSKDFEPQAYLETNPSSNIFEMRERLQDVIETLKTI